MRSRFYVTAVAILLFTSSIFAEDNNIPYTRLYLPEYLYQVMNLDPLDLPSGDDLQPFIVNGQATNYTKYKGVVGLMLSTSMGSSICTASLIDPEVLLTAGHCVYLYENNQLVLNAPSNPGSITVRNGADIMSGGSTIAKAKKVVKHETWSGKINSYGENADIALIQLDRKINNLEMYPIRNTPEETIGEQGIIVGYGITKTGAYDSGIHRWGNAKVLQKGDLMGKKNLLEVGDPSGTCQGDSGGPFFTTQQGRLVVSGITSFGGQTCYANRDGYDTWVIKYRTWIENNLKTLTGHGFMTEGGTCGDGVNDTCTAGQTKDCGAVDAHYNSGTNATCNEFCTWWDVSVCTPKCGDSFLMDTEACDGDSKDCMEVGYFLAGTNAACKSDCSGYDTSKCVATTCGDKKKEGKEFCDSSVTSCSTVSSDYDKNSYTRCKPDCSGFDMNDCINKVIVCGNNTVDPTETCDDGNTTSGDGCSSKCQTEAALPVCGNGKKETGEQCDDGNTKSGDGCSSICMKEGTVEPECGNGVKESGEECDDGNLAAGDSCNPDCTTPEAVKPECGNGIKESGEQCDDGNQAAGDSCNPDCTLPSGVTPECGNGKTEGEEECDDGNQAAGDTCNPDCTLPGGKKPTTSSNGCSLSFFE